MSSYLVYRPLEHEYCTVKYWKSEDPLEITPAPRTKATGF